jgi:ketosteroid isomerase-like protein
MSSNKINVMHDIESLDTRPTALILSIGAITFNEDNRLARRQFYEKISMADSIALGFSVSEDTENWWKKQDAMVRAEAFSGTKSVREVLELYAEYLTTQMDGQEVLLWGNSSDFDNVVIANAYLHMDMPIPWNFRNNRCYRTLKALPGIPAKPASVGNAHNALVDAVNQANHAELILNYLAGRR